MKGARLLAAAAVVAVGAALVAGIVSVGPPSLERDRKLDQSRVADLAAIENLISSFAKVHKRLPADLGSLSQEPGYPSPRLDPESGKPYEYAVLGPDEYRLCGYFRTRSTGETAYVYLPGNPWFHGAGKQCFNRRVDPGSRPDP